MAGLERALDRYKRLKAETYRENEGRMTGQVVISQQLEKAERHIVALEDRLEIVTESIAGLREATERQAAELAQIRSKPSTDFAQRLRKLEDEVIGGQESSTIEGIRRRLRDVESMCDLEVLHTDLKRYNELASELDAALKNSEKTLIVRAIFRHTLMLAAKTSNPRLFPSSLSGNLHSVTPRLPSPLLSNLSKSG